MKRKPLKFYNPQGKPIKTNKYTFKVIKTPKGLRKMAIAKIGDKKLYRFVEM